jgi:hypothetical protein
MAKTKKSTSGAVPKGFHRMPNGKLMKGSAHKTAAKRRSKPSQKRAY